MDIPWEFVIFFVAVLAALGLQAWLFAHRKWKLALGYFLGLPVAIYMAEWFLFPSEMAHTTSLTGLVTLAFLAFFVPGQIVAGLVAWLYHRWGKFPMKGA